MKTAPKYQDTEWLEKRYHDDGLSQAEIADEAGVSNKTISNWMKRHEIPVRDMADACTADVEIEPSDTWGYILGALDGDGCCSTSSGNYQAILSVADSAFAFKFGRYLGDAGLNVFVGEEKDRRETRQDRVRVTVNSRCVVEWYDSLDYDDRLAFLSDPAVAWKYVEGAYESDGWLQNRDKGHVSPAIAFWDDDAITFLENLFGRLGLDSSCYRGETTRGVAVSSRHTDRFFENVDCCIDRRVPGGD